MKLSASLGLALGLILLSSQVFAGSWSYGCVGNLPDKSLIRFNRDALVIVETALPARYSSNVYTPTENEVFRSEDNNSGFEKDMTFKTEAGKVVKITEKSSKQISTHSSSTPCGETRIRSLEDQRMLKTYSITLPDETKPIEVQLKCWESMISACG